MSIRPEYQNVYGRRGGRGFRPYLLIPKVIFVATFLGGLISLLVLAFLRPAPASLAEWNQHADLIRRAYSRVIVPALVATLLTGILLSLAHPGIFLRMRWLQAKLASIAVFVPVMHFFMRGRSLALREAIAREDLAAAALIREQLFRGTIATIIFAVAIILLGRLKPRLGQNLARTFSRQVPDVPQ